eukprot:TRINITY_DN3044_c0_g1_i1.p1 TRINITY_DN3044_c0_g1~~TRINITY_DN3044_c0_g1_i1.p1  ORF type:complete len:190 (+),score=44.40 TRINITY_DN3044_c0_g1_i1:122-691(+)
MGCASSKPKVISAAASLDASAVEAGMKPADTLLVSPRRSRAAAEKKQLETAAAAAAGASATETAAEAKDEPEAKDEHEVAIPTSPKVAEENGVQLQPARRNMLLRSHWPESPTSELSSAMVPVLAETDDQAKENGVSGPESGSRQANLDDDWLFSGCCRPNTSQGELGVSAKLRQGVPRSYVKKCSKLF